MSEHPVSPNSVSHSPTAGLVVKRNSGSTVHHETHRGRSWKEIIDEDMKLLGGGSVARDMARDTRPLLDLTREDLLAELAIKNRQIEALESLHGHREVPGMTSGEFNAACARLQAENTQLALCLEKRDKSLSEVHERLQLAESQLSEARGIEQAIDTLLQSMHSPATADLQAQTLEDKLRLVSSLFAILEDRQSSSAMASEDMLRKIAQIQFVLAELLGMQTEASPVEMAQKVAILFHDQEETINEIDCIVSDALALTSEERERKTVLTKVRELSMAHLQRVNLPEHRNTARTDTESWFQGVVRVGAQLLQASTPTTRPASTVSKWNQDILAAQGPFSAQWPPVSPRIMLKRGRRPQHRSPDTSLAFDDDERPTQARSDASRMRESTENRMEPIQPPLVYADYVRSGHRRAEFCWSLQTSPVQKETISPRRRGCVRWLNYSEALNPDLGSPLPAGQTAV